MLQDAHLEIPMSNNDDDNVNTTERICSMVCPTDWSDAFMCVWPIYVCIIVKKCSLN